MEYRRAQIAGGTFFFTTITHSRRNFFCEPENIILLRQAFRQVIAEYPFVISKWALKNITILLSLRGGTTKQSQGFR
jgi:putative transposase